MRAPTGLIPFGWDDRVAAAVAAVATPGVVPAGVVRVEPGACTITTGDGSPRARARVLPAVGDWVTARETTAARRSSSPPPSAGRP